MTIDQIKESLCFKHLYSQECLSRGSSPIKTTMKYFLDPEFHFLGAGMPPLELFGFQNFQFQTFDMGSYKLNEIPEATINNNIRLMTGDISRDEQDYDIEIAQALQYGNSRGHPALLKFLKEHIDSMFQVSRVYSDWDILINNGSTFGLESCLRVFCNRGDTILLEDLCYSSTVEAIEAQGINHVPIKMDSNGIIVEDLAHKLSNWDTLYSNIPKPKLMYVIPNGHNPKGTTLKDNRKVEIYKLLQKYDIVLLEDDPYFWLQMPDYVKYEEPELEVFENKKQFFAKLSKSFLSIDTDGRVLRFESFSKYFGPGVRLGYVVGSKKILDNLWNYHEVSLQASSGISQLMINGCLNRWGQDGFINWFMRLRTTYTQKRNFCLNTLYKSIDTFNINEFITVEKAPQAGMFFMIYLNITKHRDYSTNLIKYGKNGISDYYENLFFEKFVEAKLLLAKGSWFKVKDPNYDVCVLDSCMLRGTYAAVTPEKMTKGLEIMCTIIKEEFK
ncbi:hypothetical protein ACO0SA_002004 [Hanseniaspora valbyensis]